MPADVFASLKALSSASDVEVEEHMRRALQHYLPEEGHRLAVEGFAERVLERYRVTLDRLRDV